MVASSDRLSTSSSGGPELALGSEFPKPTHEQWQQQVEKILRRSGWLAEGEPAPDAVEDVLASTTYDGITRHPLYTAADSPEQSGTGYPGLTPFVRGTSPEGNIADGWDVRQSHAHPNPVEANREILADLHNGVTSLWLRLGDGGMAVDGLADALQGVHLDMIGVALDAGEQAASAAEGLFDIAREQDVSPSALRGNLGADPLSTRATSGSPGDREAAVALALRCDAHYTGLRALTVDGLPYHEAGGSDSEELGCSLAAATTYLRWLTEAGLDIDAATAQLEFRFAATADQFLTIAKLRAARRLWDRVARECGAAEPARAQRQHAVTSSAMLTRRDPWVNMLRTTIATFAAGVGGAQAITVQPFDGAIGLPDEFSRRIARNTQALLLDESHLAQVIDPAGGSWYVETLTDELARAAWDWFQRIEAAGGLPAALDSGLVSERLAATRQRRRDAIAHRTEPITGVTEFPNLDEQPVRREPAPQRPTGGLPRIRYAEDFELLRDAADARAEETGSRPGVFLATLGPLAAHTARASFARNLFAAGGLATPEAGPTDSAADVVEAFKHSASPVVCLCSSDTIYAERAAETALALKRAGAEHVVLAGKPSGTPPEGVDGFIHAGCDALDTLQDTHRRLGVDR
ncbi:methylmalonyl-CoA mutase family protein [Parasphingorhabdus pacifica]